MSASYAACGIGGTISEIPDYAECQTARCHENCVNQADSASLHYFMRHSPARFTGS